MNDNKDTPWQRTFEAFAGRGIHHPSDTMRVGESEARTLLADLAALEWAAPACAGAGYLVRNATRSWSTALFQAGKVVGFYAGSSLWIAPAHRGRGMSSPLILAAATHRGGTVLPPGVVFQGYTAAGLAAHRAAHRLAVLTALAGGLPVPEAVLAELRRLGQPLPAAA